MLDVLWGLLADEDLVTPLEVDDLGGAVLDFLALFD